MLCFKVVAVLVRHIGNHPGGGSRVLPHLVVPRNRKSESVDDHVFQRAVTESADSRTHFLGPL